MLSGLAILHARSQGAHVAACQGRSVLLCPTDLFAAGPHAGPAEWHEQAQSSKGKGRNTPLQTQKPTRKKKEVDDTLCLSALGTEGAFLQRVGACHRQSERATTWQLPAPCLEMSRARGTEPFPPRTGQRSSSSGLPPLPPPRQERGVFCCVLPQHSPSRPMSRTDFQV